MGDVVCANAPGKVAMAAPASAVVLRAWRRVIIIFSRLRFSVVGFGNSTFDTRRRARVQLFRQCPDFKVARLARRGAAGRSATRPTQFGHCQFFMGELVYGSRRRRNADGNETRFKGETGCHWRCQLVFSTRRHLCIKCHRRQNRRGPVFHLEFGHDSCHMLFHRARAKAEDGGDLAV